MGNVVGCRRRGAAERRLVRQPAEEAELIKHIFEFDWNRGLPKDQGSEGPITVEEAIALRITNDNGEQVTPHVAHIAFTEFKKFMFLNKIHLDEKQRRREANPEEEKTTADKLSLGLFAPPVIDAVWSILISLDVASGKSPSTKVLGNEEGERIYERFCREIFGDILDKPLFEEMDKEAKMTPRHSYDDTWYYINTFKHELNLYAPLWPDMTNETYLAEVNSLLWLNPKQVADIEELLKSNVEKDIDTVDCEELVKNAAEYLELVQQKTNAVVEKPKKFSKDKYKPSCKKHKATTVSKIYKIFTSESAGNTAFRRKLQQKYSLNEETAKSWLIEFVKFLTLRIIETDPDVSSNSFPSSIVEQVWTTYQELAYYYRDTSAAIFGETHLFPESALTSMHKREETSQRYADTLDFYEKVFEQKPSTEFWESAEDRFPAEGDHLDNDNNRRLAVNFYRLLVAKAVDKTLDTSNNLELVVFDGIEGKDYLKSNEEKTPLRENAKETGKLVDWRVNYPHFSNVYFRHKLQGKRCFPNLFEDDYEEAIALAKGGYLFFLDPHNDLTLQLAQLPKLPEVKTKSLDDIADFAETSYSFEE